MKKIEPGCMVIIISSIECPSMIGSIFKVKSYAGIRVPFDRIAAPAWFLFDRGHRPWDESCLMRIDDDANLENEEAQREKSWSQ